MTHTTLIIILLSASILALHVPTATAGDDFYDVHSESEEAADCARAYGYWACYHAGREADWAKDVTIWKFGRQGWNDAGDAFRHCIWMGALAVKIGKSLAESIGTLHEVHNNINGQSPSENLMDMRNNKIGSYLGHRAVFVAHASNPKWWVLEQCLWRARAGYLYGLGGIKGGYL